MSEKIVELAPVEPDQNLIILLEGLLEDAKKGEVLEVAFITRNRELVFGSGFGGRADDVFGMIGACEVLKARYLGLIEKSYD